MSYRRFCRALAHLCFIVMFIEMKDPTGTDDIFVIWSCNGIKDEVSIE